MQCGIHLARTQRSISFAAGYSWEDLAVWKIKILLSFYVPLPPRPSQQILSHTSCFFGAAGGFEFSVLQLNQPLKLLNNCISVPCKC